MTLSFAASITNFGHTSLCHGGVCSVMKQSLLLPAKVHRGEDKELYKLKVEKKM